VKIALLLSGGLGYSLLKFIHQSHKIEFVATDSKSDGIILYANQHGIPSFKGNPRGGKLSEFAKEFDNEVLLSINYLFIIEQDMIDLFKYPINFHGSLLPKYRGRTPHVWAIINNETETGVTAHLIDNNCDTGDIVLQEKIAINPSDTGNNLLLKYNEVYPEMVNKIIDAIRTNQLTTIRQDNSQATLFEKRTPEDGEINWEWQKERIKNWIRAQSTPYPGAFSYIDGNKIIIDEIQFTTFGFNSTIENGTIINDTPNIIVKTGNGAIELTRIREGKEFCLLNKKLGKNENRHI